MQRARSDSEKEQRRTLFLEVAERLFLAKPDTLPSVTEMVKEAHLAKGTFYLYFRTKEEVFLDILAIRYNRWLDQVIIALSDLPDFTANQLARVFLKPVIEDECFLKLAVIAQSILEVNLSSEKAISFKMSVGEKLERLAEMTSQNFGLPKQEVISLSLECYAAIVGFWQISQVSTTVEEIQHKIPYKFLFPNFQDHIEPMIVHIIRGKMETLGAPATIPRRDSSSFS